jgi:hypothetical protein
MKKSKKLRSYWNKKINKRRKLMTSKQEQEFRKKLKIGINLMIGLKDQEVESQVLRTNQRQVLRICL